MTNQIRVAIVEDDSLVALDLKTTLEGFGYQVTGHHASGEQFLNAVTKEKPDIVLMDIGLTGELDGIETARRLGELHGCPVVFVTASTDEATLQRAKLTRPYGYLIKPFDAHEIRSTIELTTFRSQESSEDPSKEDAPREEIILAEESSGDVRERALNFFKESELFTGADQNTLSTLARAALLKNYEAGELILFEGEPNEFGFIVVNGRLSVMKSAESGKELIVSLLAPGDTYGLLFAFEELSGHASVRAQIGSRILIIPSEVLRKLAQSDARFAQIMMGVALNRLAGANELSINLAHSRVEDRIVTALLHLLPEFGKPSADSSESSRIYITRKELADLTGTTPETAIRVTKSLEREGLLDLSRPGIIKMINLPEIRARQAS